MKKTRLFALLLALCLLLSLLVACGQGSSSANASSVPAENNSASEPAASEPEAAQEAETLETEPEEAEEASATEEASASEEDAEPELPEPEPFALPITDEETTLTLWMRTEPFTIAYPEITMDNATFYKEMAARTNVSVDITGIIAFQADENFNLMVASGDYCDMIGRFATFYTAGLDAGIDNGIIVDMSEFMDNWMPNYQYVLAGNAGFRRACTTAEGRVLKSPRVSSWAPSFVRTGWTRWISTCQLPMTTITMF